MVPTSKPRVKEMADVRDSLKWNEVYKVVIPRSCGAAPRENMSGGADAM